jgi:Zn-dependent peptidase ImmA (M78 family)
MSDHLTDARYKFAEAEGNRIWKTIAGGKIPVILNDIVKALGVKVCAEEIPAYIRSDGVSQMDGAGNCIIRYRKGTSEVRARFTVAHELGHIILEHISFDGSSSRCSVDAQEKEANTFASGLLIPVPDLRNFLKTKDKTIDDVTKRYWVSKEVASYAVNKNRLLSKLVVAT